MTLDTVKVNIMLVYPFICKSAKEKEKEKTLCFGKSESHAIPKPNVCLIKKI